jgi:hypothetical protein
MPFIGFPQRGHGASDTNATSLPQLEQNGIVDSFDLVWPRL